MYSKRYETTIPGKFIEVTLSYRKGGMNYFTSKVQRRGYYVGATPVEIELHDGYETKCMGAFTEVCQCVLEVTRASLKSELAADELARAAAGDLVKFVASQNNLTLK